MRRIIAVLVAVSLSISVGLISPVQASTKGSTYVDKSRARSIGSTVCAKVGKQSRGMYIEVWTAGKWINRKNGHFISYRALASNASSAAKKAKGSKKKKLVKQSAAYSKLNKTFTPKCKKVNGLKVNLAGKSGVAKGNISVSSLRAIKGSGSSEIRQIVGAGMNVFAVDAQGRFQSMFPNIAALMAANNPLNGMIVTLPTATGMISGPNEKIYISFASRFNFDDLTDPWSNNNSCMLAVVVPSSTSLSCVDKELINTMNWQSANQGNPSVQFDASGAAYYKGQFVKGGGYQNPDNTYTALRRNVNGAIKDIVQGRQITINDFVVIPNGDVIVSGYTNLNNSSINSWVRLYPSDGGDIVDLSGGGWGGFMRVFPDENVYFGGQCSANGLSRFLTQSKTVDGSYTFRGQNNSCGSLYMGDLDFGTANRSDDYIFTLNGSNATQLWPQSDPINPTAISRPLGMSNPSMIEGAGSLLVIGGAEKVYSQVNGALLSTTYKTNILNPIDGSVTEVTGARGIEVYALAYAGNGNLILNGQNRRGATVTGLVSLEPGTFGEFTLTQSDSGRVDDVQLFGQTN